MNDIVLRAANSSDIVLRTSNKRKIAEFKRLCTDLYITLKVAKGEDVREVMADSATVALYKAKMMPEGTLVEDTILLVDGVEIVDVRYRLKDLPASQLACWRTTLAHHAAGGEIRLYEGEVWGNLFPGLPDVPGAFGFDPYFIPETAGRTLAELEELGRKDAFSARRQALVNLYLGKVRLRKNAADLPEWTGPWQG